MWVAVLLIVSAVAAGVLECRRLGYTHYRLEIAGLPPSLDGLRVVHLTDLHVGLMMRPGAVRDVVRKVNALRPDLVLMTGDYVNILPSNIGPMARSLRGLRAKHGVYAVLGNHDYWTGGSAVARALAANGFTILTNDRRAVKIGGDRIWVAGFDDIWAGKPDYVKPLRGIDAGDTCIALAHNPDALAALRGRPVDLLLSGHTHGGQVVVPGYGPIYSAAKDLPRENASGLVKMGGVQAFTSRGVGQITPIRFNCPPEVAVLTLRRTGGGSR